MKTVKDLIEDLKKYPEAVPVRMCMDFTEQDKNTPQYEDDYKETAFNGECVYLLNKNFR